MSRTLSMFLVAGALVGAGLLIAGASTLKGEQPGAPPAGTPVEAAGFVGKTAMLDSTGYSVGRRIFAPRSHNATWHAHTAGQLVFADRDMAGCKSRVNPSGYRTRRLRLRAARHDALARVGA